MSEDYRRGYVRLDDTRVMTVWFYAGPAPLVTGFAVGECPEWRTDDIPLHVFARHAAAGMESSRALFFRRFREVGPPELVALLPGFGEMRVGGGPWKPMAMAGSYNVPADGVKGWAGFSKSGSLAEHEADPIAATAGGYCPACGGEHGTHRRGCPVEPP